MRFTPIRTRLAPLGALASAAALATFVPAGAASATVTGQASVAHPVTLNGDWAPFTRCPVDDPVMLAADGVTNIPLCVASGASTGSVKIGNVALSGGSNLQFGLISNASTGFSIVSPPGGAIVAPPVAIPGGLRGMICPGNNPIIERLCRHILSGPLNRLTAQIQPAGDPSNFSLIAGVSAGQPILTLPVRIRLANPLLGPDCTIGTTAAPIVLHPENQTAPTVQAEAFDGNGTPNPNGAMNAIFGTGVTQQDLTFSVPGATGCGPFGLADNLINAKVGLPSPSGNNSLTLNNASAYLAGLADAAAAAPHAGRLLSRYWHSAVLS